MAQLTRYTVCDSKPHNRSWIVYMTGHFEGVKTLLPAITSARKEFEIVTLNGCLMWNASEPKHSETPWNTRLGTLTHLAICVWRPTDLKQREHNTQLNCITIASRRESLTRWRASFVLAEQCDSFAYLDASRCFVPVTFCGLFSLRTAFRALIV